ncbi:MAG TPA: nucleotide exchange factor GrpE [Thermoleophilaceae bacterium]|nr:nucleotide exchange factor GrpE [Thermoleophilaceae bacterium]
MIEEIPEEATAQPDPAEPAGDQDPGTEKEYDEAKEEAVDDAASDPAADAARYLELAQRTQAELENVRKRAARDIAQAGQRAKANLVRELLPIVDNLERALATANPEEDHLAEGVRLVHVELVNTLERNGIMAFDPAGEPFDPNVHEAISMREGENGSGIVLDVVEKGYKLGDNVIRPARVVVSS